MRWSILVYWLDLCPASWTPCLRMDSAVTDILPCCFFYVLVWTFCVDDNLSSFSCFWCVNQALRFLVHWQSLTKAYVIVYFLSSLSSVDTASWAPRSSEALYVMRMCTYIPYNILAKIRFHDPYSQFGSHFCL